MSLMMCSVRFKSVVSDENDHEGGTFQTFLDCVKKRKVGRWRADDVNAADLAGRATLCPMFSASRGNGMWTALAISFSRMKRLHDERREP
jgi:hypothetical protein